MPQYQWIRFDTARQTLAGRLADPNNVFWTDAECGAYLIEALRTWNALTETWNTDFTFNPTTTQVWYDLSTLTGSPRLRTLTDASLYTMMQYHLLEPPSGVGPWTGTSQFALADLQGALQRRRDEMIQFSGCNLSNISPVPSTVNARRTRFPDTVLEPRRARFVPADGFGVPNTMTREDSLAWDAFEPAHMQSSSGPRVPQSWSVVSGPPLSMDVDVSPSVPGQYDVIALVSGPTFAPPATTLLGVPDDWAWLAKWGALADLLSRESEATDRLRADYCLKRYNDGLKIMRHSNWLLSASAAVQNIPVDTPSLREMDAFAPEWQDDGSILPVMVTAGIDLIAPCPVGVPSMSLVLVGNAPIPVLNSDFVQVSRDVFDAVLDYAQVLAAFKMGGADFTSTKDLEKNFFLLAEQTNKRLMKMGLFLDTLHYEGKRQDVNVPR